MIGIINDFVLISGVALNIWLNASAEAVSCAVLTYDAFSEHQIITIRREQSSLQYDGGLTLRTPLKPPAIGKAALGLCLLTMLSQCSDRLACAVRPSSRLIRTYAPAYAEGVPHVMLPRVLARVSLLILVDVELVEPLIRAREQATHQISRAPVVDERVKVPTLPDTREQVLLHKLQRADVGHLKRLPCAYGLLRHAARDVAWVGVGVSGAGRMKSMTRCCRGDHYFLKITLYGQRAPTDRARVENNLSADFCPWWGQPPREFCAQGGVRRAA